MAESEIAMNSSGGQTLPLPAQLQAAPDPLRKYAQLYARVALGAALLSAVADRFGLWGPYGHKNVAWGDFGHFVQYSARVNSFLPAQIIPALAWGATAAETALGVCLIVGIYRRIVALSSGALLLMFAVAMTISFGVKSPLDYSVFSASAAAFLLFATDQTPAARNTKERSAVRVGAF
jgi:uncharacterized membrane protein YphA (DoxX/SURF4 family)